MLLLVIVFHIECLWLQLCIGSHGHVCDLGLSAHAVYLGGLLMITIICAALVTVYYCTVLYCTVLFVWYFLWYVILISFIRQSSNCQVMSQLVSCAVVNSSLSLILFHEVTLNIEHCMCD